MDLCSIPDFCHVEGEELKRESKGFSTYDSDTRTLERELIEFCRKFHNARLVITGNPDKHTITFRIESK